MLGGLVSMIRSGVIRSAHFELVKCRLRFRQVFRVEPLGEGCVDWRQHVPRLRELSPLRQEAREVGGRTQLEQACAALTREPESMLERCDRLEGRSPTLARGKSTTHP